LLLRLDASLFDNGLLEHLAAALEPYRRGNCPVWVEYARPDARVEIAFDRSWNVRPEDALLNQLRGLVGEGGVRLDY